MKREFVLHCFVIVTLLALLVATPAVRSQNETPPNQEQSEKEKPKKKKKGGFFSGLKAVTGESSEQQEVTATAGSKTIGEGEQIGDTQPTAAHRQAVTGMEKYALPEAEVKKFQEDGKLNPEQ